MATATRPATRPASPVVTLDDAALNDWAQGLATRIGLQAEIVWVGLNDGYQDAGGKDVAIPYLGLYWILGVAQKHCGDCPEIAAASPYDPPGKGPHTIYQSPGDGSTQCGAGCKCWLEYGLPQVSLPPAYAWDGVNFPGPGKATVEGGLASDRYGWHETQLLDPQDETFTVAQRSALDFFRAKSSAWEALRGDLPALPEMFAAQDQAQDLRDLESFWGQMSAQQRATLLDVQDAIVDWNDATATANGLTDFVDDAPQVDATDAGDTGLMEASQDAILLARGSYIRGRAGRFNGSMPSGEAHVATGRHSAAQGEEVVHNLLRPNAGAMRHHETPYGQRPESHTDETGQAMPFSHGEFRLALRSMRPLGAQSGANHSGTIEIGGKRYFAKAVTSPYHRDSGAMSGQHIEATNEVVAHGVAHAIGMGRNVPAESYHLAFKDIGSNVMYHWNVMTLEHGAQTFSRLNTFTIESPGGRLDPAVERALMRPDASRHLILEYLIGDGHGDRHEGNVMFDGRAEGGGRIVHIDFGREFPTEHQFLIGFSAVGMAMLKAHNPGIVGTPLRRARVALSQNIRFEPAFLRQVARQRDAILSMAGERGLNAFSGMVGLARRLDTIERLSHEAHPTALDLRALGEED